MISLFSARKDNVESMIAASYLSEEAKSRYFSKFADRLRAIAQ